MYAIARLWLRQSLALAAAAAPLAGCGDESPTGTDGPSGLTAPVEVTASSTQGGTLPDLGSCQYLSAPEGTRLFHHVYAEGVQIYRWTGTVWTFVEPSATLFADAAGTATVGTHYAGPTWRSVSGGKVVGALNQKCPVDPADVPWLLLDVVSDSGPGVFQGASHIQRLNTVGGQAPATPGSFTNELAEVPYTADYYFYRAP